MARRIAAVELGLLLVLVGLAFALAGIEWCVPFLVALPLFVVELWFDARSRGRQLVPELCGAVGISAAAAAIALAGGEGYALPAVALWLVLTARAVASVPFARVQVLRLRSVPPSTRPSDLAELVGVIVAVLAVAVDDTVLLGAVAVVVLAAVQYAWSRVPARPAKVVGVGQLGFGLAVVAATAIGVAA